MVAQPVEPPVVEAPSPARGRVEGQVLELGTGEPLVAVLVIIARGEGEAAVGFEAWTDEEGRFGFADLEPGVWRVLAESEGYYPLRTAEQVEAGVRVEAVYRLERQSYNTLDVLVEGRRGRSYGVRRAVPIEEIERVPGVFGDPLKILQTLPGVAQTNVLTSDVVVRGGAPEDTAFYALGLQVPAVFHFGGIRGIFPAPLVDEVALYPGDFPVRYGRSIGGVVDVVPPSDAGRRFRGSLDMSLLDTTLAVEAPITDDVWVAAAGRRSYFDLVVAGVNLALNEPIVLPRYWDGHLQVGWRPSDTHDVRVFAFAGDDDFVAYGPQDRLNFDEDDLPELSLAQTGARHVWYGAGALEQVESVVGLGWWRVLSYESALGVLEGLGAGRFETRTTRLSARSEARLRLGPDTLLQTGVEGVWSDGSLRSERDLAVLLDDILGDPISDDLPADLPVGLPSRQEGYTLQGYGTLAGWMDLALAWPDVGMTWVPGLRVERYGQLGASVFSPRLRVEAELSPMWTLLAAVGLMHQPPRPIELDPTLGTPRLEPERAVQASLGARIKPWRRLELDVGVFGKRMSELVVLEEVFPPRYTNAGRGRAYGLEALVRWPLHARFHGWIAYTLSRSERLNLQTQQMEVFAFDQTHNLTVVAATLLPRNWSISGRFRYASGFPIYARSGLEQVLDRGVAFIQSDVRVDKMWIYNAWTLNAYFDIQNITNRLNLSGVERTGEDGTSVPPPGVPILPILGVKAAF